MAPRVRGVNRTIIGRVMAVAVGAGLNPGPQRAIFASDVINLNPAGFVGDPDVLDHRDANVEVILMDNDEAILLS